MKKIVALLVGISIVLLAACGNDDANSDSENVEVSLEPVKVEFLTKADAFQPGEEGTIEVQVTQGDENVADANEVVFEIWKNGNQDNSEKFDAENVGDGVYSLKHTFMDAGIYQVTSHVTARDMHTMPTMEFNVGNVTEDAQEHGDHHDTDLMIMLMKPDEIEANKDVTLMAHIQKENEAFTEASVEFEYWQDGDEKHTYIKTSENEEGKYQATVSFDKTGEYHVKIHVKKDDLHTHKEVTVEVK